MAKKTKKQKQRATQRRPVSTTSSAVRPATAAETEDEADEEGDAPAATGAPVRRRVERVNSTTVPAARMRQRGRPQGSSAALFAPLDSDEPAIPFDRVPYVPADLRRVAIIALVMIALILIAMVIVNNVVK